MWKITMTDRSEQIYAGAYTNDHVAVYNASVEPTARKN